MEVSGSYTNGKQPFLMRLEGSVIGALDVSGFSHYPSFPLWLLVGWVVFRFWPLPCEQDTVAVWSKKGMDFSSYGIWQYLDGRSSWQSGNLNKHYLVEIIWFLSCLGCSEVSKDFASAGLTWTTGHLQQLGDRGAWGARQVHYVLSLKIFSAKNKKGQPSNSAKTCRSDML